MLQSQLLGAFRQSSETFPSFTGKPEKLWVPRAHYKVKILVQDIFTTLITTSSFLYKNTFLLQKKFLWKNCHSNQTSDFLLIQKQTCLPSELNIHACNVIQILPCLWKITGYFFVFLLLNRWTKKCFHSRTRGFFPMDISTR